MEPVNEPIESVSIDLNPAAKKPLTAKAQNVIANQMKVTPTKPSESAAVAESATQLTASPNSTAYESGNVSVKPKVKKQIQIVYPQQAKDARIEGPVKLSVVINAEGSVADVSVLEGPGYGLDEAAREALKQFEFSPAEVEGRKVPVRIVYVYRFRLESR